MRGLRRLGVALLLGVSACGGESRPSHSGAPADVAGAASGSSGIGGGGSSGTDGGASSGASAGAPGTGGGGSSGASAGAPDGPGATAGALGGGTAGASAMAGGGMTANTSGGSGAVAGQASALVPIEQVSEALADAYCTLRQRCEQGLSTNGFVMAGEDCVLLTKKRLELNGLELLAAAVSAGRIEYHPELMQACHDAITSQECQDTIERDLPACEAAITGSAALGEPCKLSEECQGSLICDTRASCPGTCAERYGEGVRCSVDAECADGLGCDPYGGACHKAVNVGETCEGDADLPCLPGLFCAKEVEEALTMHRPVGTCADIARGQPGGTPACDPLQGLLCGVEEGQGPGHCVLESLVEDNATWVCDDGPGDTCGLALPEQCPDGQFCPIQYEALERGELTATCTPLPLPGAPCAYRPLLPTILPWCAPYARCDSSGTCRELGEVGALCEDDEHCYTGYCTGFQCARIHACP